MVGTKLRLKAIFSLALRRGHDSGVVDDDIYAVRLAEDVLSSLLDRRKVVQCHFHERDLPTLGIGGDLIDDLLPCSMSALCSILTVDGLTFGHVSRCSKDMSACGIQCSQSLYTNAAADTSDYEYLVCQLADEAFVLHDL